MSRVQEVIDAPPERAGGNGGAPPHAAARPLADTLPDIPCRDAAGAAVARPLAVIPVLSDGSPDWEHHLQQVVMYRSHAGIELELSSPGDFAKAMRALVLRNTTALLLVFRDGNGALRCAGMEVVGTPVKVGKRIHVQGRLGGPAEELLNPERLTPTFDRERMDFRLGFSEAALRRWEEIGVLRGACLDRVQVCPRCHGLPTFRPGCRQCGSARLVADRLIHHFACAHVGLVGDFEDRGEPVCPKCRVRSLVIGSDYEYLTGPYRCLDCSWSDTEREQVAQCLRCRFRFPGHQAHELELKGYHADRLDLLALLPAS